MKKTINVLCICIFFIAGCAFTLNAQNKWNGNDNVNDPIWRNGRVGIGTDTPDKPLHIKCGNNHPLLLENNSGYGDIMFRVANHTSGEQTGWITSIEGTSESTNIFNIGTVNNDLASGWSPKFSINRLGNVGIGTTSPGSKLEVNGTIKAEEIIVENVSADHVFKSDYALRSLDEVEKYIKDNGHLPDIAPASETQNGIKISEFNTLLLEKIEELTLYTIEQNKKIKELQLIINK